MTHIATVSLPDGHILDKPQPIWLYAVLTPDYMLRPFHLEQEPECLAWAREHDGIVYQLTPAII